MEETTCKDVILEVPIDEVRVSPFQPRRHFSEQDLDGLMKSIKSVGLIQPPVVREIKSGSKLLYYELIAGERRWRAAKMVGLELIPVIIKVTTDSLAAEASLIENLQRVNLNPIEMAEAFKKLIEVFGLTQDKVALKVGKKRSTVANYLRLLTLTDDIKDHISAGLITLGHAKVILSLEDLELRRKLSDLIIKKDLAVREAELEAKNIICNEQEESSTVTTRKVCVETQQKLEVIEQLLKDKISAKVSIKSKGKNSVIVLKLKGIEPLDRLENLLKIS